MTEAEKGFSGIEVKDWSVFSEAVDFFDITIPPIPMYGYRGQSKSYWDLVPSFHRHFKSTSLPKTEELLGIELDIKEDFYSQAHLSLSANLMSVTKDDLESWMLMQHHHAPTRLLDWTLSPYVAAYYACRENVEEDGAVWLLHGASLHKQMENAYGVDNVPPGNIPEDYFVDPNSTEEVFFVNPEYKTDRMVAQQGLFTVCRNISGIHHNIICDVLAESGESENTFVKIIIPHDQKIEFLRKLRTMNITANSLFPGLDGLGQSVNELVLLNAYKMKKEILKNKAPSINDILGSKNDEQIKKQLKKETNH